MNAKLPECLDRRRVREVRVREPLGQIGYLAAKRLDFGNESRRLGAGAASSSSVRDRIESSNDG